jgi:hypothetical protein
MRFCLDGGGSNIENRADRRRTRMKRLLTILLVMLGGASCSGRPEGPPQAAAQPARTASPAILETPTQVIRIPTYRLTSGSVAKPENAGALTIKPEAEDEEAEGPQSFVVLEDGRFVIADPLRDRLAVYSAAGTFERGIDLGAPASEVSLQGERLRVVIATDATARLIDLDGRPAPAPVEVASTPSEADIVLDSERSGVVRWKGGAAPASAAAGVKVQLDNPQMRLASLRVIGGQPDGLMYVSAESAERSGRSLSTVGTLVRRYSADGELQVEVRNILLDYYVTPKTPFRVARNTLYQLYPQLDAVLIHVWTLP